MRFCFTACVAALWMAGAAQSENFSFSPRGRLTTLYYEGEELPVRTDIGFALEGRLSPSGLDNASSTSRTRKEGVDVWTASLESPEGQRASCRQEVSETGGRTRFRVEIIAQTDIAAEGLYFRIDAPRQDFAGGTASFGGDAEELRLPVKKPAGREFVRTAASRVRLTSASGGLRLEAGLGAKRGVLLVDRWERSGRYFTILVRLAEGGLARGATASADITLAASGRTDGGPARLFLDAGAIRYQLHGIGGNYCFNIESPVTQYTLENLNVAWGRTEMSAWLWEPVNDNESPYETDWETLVRNDRPGSRLRNEILLGRRLQEKGIPYCVSIWRLPEWLYDDPGAGPRKSRRRIALGKWEELLENIGSYLGYAKKQYGVEPDLFSFNEANIGIDVLLTPEEHRDALKSIGAHFERMGLKTRLLLADATGPRGTHEYALAAAGDPAALKYAGAVGFHSWGGATPEQYRAWGDLAEWLNLPLLVTELGVDAAAWQNRMYDSFRYGMREVRMYQEILLHARPQATLQWEFTGDYGIARVSRESESRVVPTARFWQVKHFADLTPRGSEALTTMSDQAKVLFTAFRGSVEGKSVYTLHISNHGGPRRALIEGIPNGVGIFNAVRTSEGEAFRSLDPVSVSGGRVEIDLPAACLVTLTTGPVR